MQSFMKQNIVKPKTLACYICGRQQTFDLNNLSGSEQDHQLCISNHVKKNSKYNSRKRLKTRQELNVLIIENQVPQQPEMLDVILNQIENNTLDMQILEKYNQQARNIHKYKVLPSCKFCGRTFNEQSLISHMKACPKKDSSSNFQQKSAYKIPDDMKKPRTLACCVCGRQFGLLSLKIHYPQCKQKFKNEELKKPYKQRNPTPQFSKQDEEMFNTKIDWTLQEINQFNQRATQNYRNKALVQCQNCKRKFLPESYLRHAKNCKLLNGDNVSQSLNLREQAQNSKNIYQQVIKKPKVLMCHICGRQFGLTSLKIHQKTCVQKWINEQKKKPKSQRKPLPELIFDNNQNLDLDNAAQWDMEKIEKYNSMANQVYKGCSLFPCSICGRKFFQQSLARHFKYCEKNAQQKRLKQQATKTQPKALKNSVNSLDFQNKSKKEEVIEITSNISIIKSNSKIQESQKAQQIKISEDQQKIDHNNKSQIDSDVNVNFNATINEVNQDLQSTLKQNVQDQLINNQPLPQLEQVKQKQIIQPKKLQQQNIDIDRVECAKCKRKFASDRISKHQSICKGQIKKVSKPIVEQQTNNEFIPKFQQQQKSKQSKPLIREKQLKKAQQKQQDLINQLTQCIKCGKKFMPSKIEKHEAKCKDVAYKVKNKQKKEEIPIKQQQCQAQEVKSFQQKSNQNQIEARKNQINPHSKIKLQKIPDPNEPKKIAPQINNSKLPKQIAQQASNNLIKCKYCSRKFGQDRIEKHQNVCLNKKQFELKEKQNIQQSSKTNGLKNNKITGINKNEPSKIQAPQNYLQTPIQQGEHKLNLIPCSKCGRKFDSQRVQKHENICKGQFVLKKQNDKNLIKNSQSQNENKDCTNEFLSISKTTEISKKNNFHIKMISKQHQKQKQSKPDITSSQVMRKISVKQNLQIAEKIMNQIWDTKETHLKHLQKIETKTNLNQTNQKKLLPNANKTALDGEFHKGKPIKQGKQQNFDIDESQKLDRVPCKKCGRKFATDRIDKHQEICKISLSKDPQTITARLKRTSTSQIKQPLRSAQKFYQAKQQFSPSHLIPEPQKIIKHFKEIKNMKINESFIDNELQRQLHELNLKRPLVNEIKNSGFGGVNRARNTFGGGQKFYCRNDKSPGKIETNEQKDNSSKSPKPILAKKWFK